MLSKKTRSIIKKIASVILRLCGKKKIAETATIINKITTPKFFERSFMISSLYGDCFYPQMLYN